MRSAASPFYPALAVSVLLHAALFVTAGGTLASLGHAVPIATPLNVTLRPAQPPVETLRLPETPLEAPRKKVAPRPPERRPSIDASSTSKGSASSTGAFPRLSGEAERQAKTQIARELLYPAQAIAQGLEGEALVLLVLDESGNAIAARLEGTSGHALLDNAAVRAARTLRGLPDGVPREVLLPVRFRLR